MVDITAIEAIFFAALEKPSAAERAAYLRDACGDDAELRARIERMLAAQPQAVQFLNGGGPAGTIDQPPATEQSGALIAGRYKLLEEIGEGGMGNVWMAEQREPVKRLVAVKVIKPGMDSRAVLARFEAERQALALMDHPSIAKVLDGGTTESGRPFFVMELVKGLPLTEYCDDRRLNVRQRLELFAQVCSAVQHAHTKGVIHRDLKPTNILVTEHDGKPMPKVIDFGLAKALNASSMLTERTLHTAYGTVVGTPLYMAPEQVGINALDVDTRTDIYALGVILYELLTGTTPLEKKQFKEAAWEEIRRLIREEEPPRPSTRLSTSNALPSLAACRQTEPGKLSRLVRGELDWIVLKALEKDRNRRYETANGLAMDIQRHLSDEPVLACPPTVAYRMRKFAHKHRGPVLAVSLLLLVLTAGIVGTTYGMIRLNAERQRALDAEAEAKMQAQRVTQEQEQRKRLEVAEKLAKENETASRWKAMKALQAPTDDLMDQVRQWKVSLGPAERARLEQDLVRMQAFAAESGADEPARAIRARAARQVARLRHELDQTNEAIASCKDAIAQYTALQADFPANGEYRNHLADSLIRFASLLTYVGQRDEAEAARQRALSIDAKLVKDFPGVPRYRLDLAWDYCFLADSFNDRGKKSESEEAYRRSVAEVESLAAEVPSDTHYAQDLASLLDRQARNFLGHGKVNEADASHRRCLKQLEGLAKELGTDVRFRQQVASVHFSWGRAQDDRRNYIEALESFRRAMAMFESLLAESPSDPIRRRDVAVTSEKIGSMQSALGKFEEAEAAQRRALVVFEKLSAEFPTITEYRRDLGRTLNTLAIVLGDMGKNAEKEAAFRQALDVRVRIVAENPIDRGYRRDLAQSQRNWANVLSVQGRTAEAVAACRDAIANLDKLLEQAPTVADYRHMMAWSQHRLGQMLRRQDSRAEAETAFRKSLTILQKLTEEFPRNPRYRQDVGQSLESLFFVVFELGRNVEAEEICRQGLAVREKLSNDFPEDPEFCEHLLESQGTLSWFFLKMNKLSDSLEWRTTELATFKRLPEKRTESGWARTELAHALQQRAEVLESLGRYDEAAIDWTKAADAAIESRKPLLLSRRAISRVRTGATQEALQEAENFLPKADSVVFYNAGCAYAVAAAQTKDANAAKYADRAMELLRQSFEKGFLDVEHAKKDDDLTALRERPDFQKLLADMAAAQAAKKQSPEQSKK
jgi:serine/threonine protein kinase/tetratricopeptide (TPR) repeat protein